MFWMFWISHTHTLHHKSNTIFLLHTCNINIQIYIYASMWYRFISSSLCVMNTLWCFFTLRWRHNDHGGVSNHQPHDCLLNRLFRRRSKKTSKAPCHWPLCKEFNGTGEFPAQRASYAENVSIWWRHHDTPNNSITSAPNCIIVATN